MELLAEDVRLEEAPISSEELPELLTLRSAHGPPATREQPALAAAVGTHHGARPEELLSADFVECRRSMLQDMELVEDNLGVLQHGADRVHIRLVHVGADGLDSRALSRIEARGQQPRQAALGAVRREAEHLTVDDI